MYQTGGTIKDTLAAIERHGLVLPAIQREFVWKPEQICALFDSLMQGYPFGTFLYWQVNPETADKFTYYDFVRQYHERDAPYCLRLEPMPGQALTAVLDGQQRLTALNIGFRGSMAWKLPYKRRSNPDAYPVRRLHLDLLSTPRESGKYRFEFLGDDHISATECWFCVSDVLSMDSGPEIVRWLNEQLPQEQVDQAYDALWKLHHVAHTQPVIAYYNEKNQELEQVLQIFIRMNSGGTSLSYSDMLLSVATAQWSTDAREEVRTFVKQLNGVGDGFSFSKDLVLKAGLMMSDISDIGFRVANFNKSNMNVLESKWEDVKRSLLLAVRLIACWGFSSHTLRADSAVLPIAYYLSARNRGNDYLESRDYAGDRETIRQWLVHSILKASGIWGSGLDTLLTTLREVIRNNDGLFPATQVRKAMAGRGRSLDFEREEVENLVDVKYGDSRAFVLLSLLFPFVDTSRHHFHIDHVFPRKRFSKAQLRRAGIADAEHDDFMDRRDRLANLQLLEGKDNIRKSEKLPACWINETMNAEERENYSRLHRLGTVPVEMNGFREFYDARRRALLAEIGRILGVQMDQNDG